MSDRNPFFVTPEWLEERLGQPGLKIVDGSWYLPAQKRDARKEYDSGHIPGAVFFDHDKVVDPDSDLPHTLPSPGIFAKFAGATGPLVVSGPDWYLAADGGVWHGAGLSHATRRGASPCPEHKGFYGPYLAISDRDSLDAVCSGDAAMGSASYLVYGSNDGAR